MKLCRLENFSRKCFSEKYFSRWKKIQHFSLKILKKSKFSKKSRFSKKSIFSKTSIFLRIFNEKMLDIFSSGFFYFFDETDEKFSNVFALKSLIKSMIFEKSIFSIFRCFENLEKIEHLEKYFYEKNCGFFFKST